MILTKTKLAKAIALAITGSALSVGVISDASAAATTMYNLTTSAGADNSTNTTNPTLGGTWALSGNTDGWLYDYTNPSNGTDTSIAKWAGTTGTNTTPFGYIGAQLNWGLHFSGKDTAEISTFDSFTRYGVYADVDTAKGAWSDNSQAGAGGWRHDLEFGLFKSDVGGTITLNASTITPSAFAFGFTIFKGMNTGLGYNHHGLWNANNNASGLTAASLPGGGTSFGINNAAAIANIVAYSVGGANPSNLNSISFNADPNQIYTIVLGGYRNGSYIDTVDGYRLKVSAVPVPGAVWLFGSAITGLIGFGRRKGKKVA